MPPAAQDNQGLKIAVAVFVTLSVLLAVATYFGFSNMSFYQERYGEEQKKASQAVQAQNALQGQFNDLKERAGYAKTEDTAVVAALTKDQESYNDQITQIADRMEQVYNEYQTAGGSSPQADEFINQARSSAASFQSEANRTQASAISRLIELLSLESQLLASIAADYQVVRKDLEAANQIAQSKVDVEVRAKEDIYKDHMDELAKHEEDRRSLINQVDALQSKNTELSTLLATAEDQARQYQEDAEKKFDLLNKTFLATREQLEKDENVLERADGFITFIDHGRGEVRTTLNRGQGAREQLVFSVFDKDAAGLPSDKPKATVELIRVDAQGSIGRITKQFRTTDPIRRGDQLYSPAFSSSGQQTFALIGKIDINQDGVDDRKDLTRMIRAAGGDVVYDLPPPGAGRASGELTPSISWYVLDDRESFYPGSERESGASNEEQQAFENARTKALSEARRAGIRPIAINRLLDYIGYSFGQPVRGQSEGVNAPAVDRLLRPQGNQPTQPVTPPTGGEAEMEDPF